MRDADRAQEDRRPSHPSAQAARRGPRVRAHIADRHEARVVNRRIFDTSTDAMSALARLIEQKAQSQEHLSVGISGGATPRPLYELLGSSPLRETLAGRSITWVLVDERYVASNDPQSNARMIRATLFRDGVSPAHRFLDFDTDLDRKSVV